MMYIFQSLALCALAATLVSAGSAGYLAKLQQCLKPKTAVQLPDLNTFLAQNGTKWSIKYVGDLQFSGYFGQEQLLGDKCRSSVLGGRTIWNCGDMMCGKVWCGFSMGASFYGGANFMTIDASSKNTHNIGDYNFALPWANDPKPQSPQTAYGMDTSNVAPLSATSGIAYVWEITRSDEFGAYVDQGAGVVLVTLGSTQPVATRVGPLLTGPQSVQMGLVAIMRDGNYIYNYNQEGGFGNILVGRVPATQSAVLDPTQYEYLVYPSSLNAAPQWVKGIPNKTDAAKYGMITKETSGRFTCEQYGSVFWHDGINKYMLMCPLYMSWTFFYLADKPYGPWSIGYKILSMRGYGVHAHPQFTPKGSKDLYFSQGPNGPFNMFKLTINY